MFVVSLFFIIGVQISVTGLLYCLLLFITLLSVCISSFEELVDSGNLVELATNSSRSMSSKMVSVG